MVLLGRGIRHSLSPRMWEGIFAELSLSGSYALRDVDKTALDAAIADLRAGRVTHFHVTMPYKRWAFGVADTYDDSTVGVTQVANSLSLKGDQIMGSNTDVKAARILFSELPAPPQRVLVIGAGATAASLVCAANEVASTVLITNRTDDRSRALADRDWSVRTVPVLWSDRERHAAGADLIINTAPFGLTVDATPLARWPEGALLYDLIYSPELTPLQRLASRAGVRAVDGLAHLQAHAEATLAARTIAAPTIERMTAIVTTAAGRAPTRWGLLNGGQKSLP
ncbi:hypothetical protein E3O06_00700 [Cryobacterium glaciale]|uniref:shikimate dehydrogenase (NADP(+)) n=1 Tax=Cryobacterium glaciale TaxID=1259145 RepID=A0A4V3I8Z5_9MICO|nr:hypothetical protein [Cryobacterium glaciale]TFB77307.1 hypothetical protein E3O06_00700 [Cryobacterium glaciale]